MPDPITRDESDPRWHALQSYVKAIAARMGLSLWDIFIVVDEPSECGPPDTDDAEIAATTQRSYTTLTASMRFSDRFFRLSREDQRRIVVHELVHVLNIPRDRVKDGLESCGALGSREYSLFNMHYEYADETITDTVARLLEPYYPLIEWEPQPTLP